MTGVLLGFSWGGGLIKTGAQFAPIRYCNTLNSTMDFWYPTEYPSNVIALFKVIVVYRVDQKKRTPQKVIRKDDLSVYS